MCGSETKEKTTLIGNQGKPRQEEYSISDGCGNSARDDGGGRARRLREMLCRYNIVVYVRILL
jgi:hypothetical protein